MDKAEEAGRSNEASGGGHPVGGPQMPQPLWLAGPSVRWPGATASQSLRVARQVPSGGRCRSSPVCSPALARRPAGPGHAPAQGRLGSPEQDQLQVGNGPQTGPTYTAW